MKRDKFTYFPDGGEWEKCPGVRSVSVYAIFYDTDYSPLDSSHRIEFSLFDSDIQSLVHMGSTRDMRLRDGKILLSESDIDFTSEGHKILDDMKEIYGHEPAIALIRG